MGKMVSAIFWGTAVAGILDILSAVVFTSLDGRSHVKMLQSIASGPFGDSVAQGGLLAAGLGLAVHFFIMACMVSVFVSGAIRFEWMADRWLAAGIVYGIVLYAFMYWLVLPLRWPAIHPRTDLVTVGRALFAHIVCVGIPMAYVVARQLRYAPTAT